MAAVPSFKLPQAFLTQLGEFTTGYFLVAVNDKGEFETFIQADSPVGRLGILKFTGMVLDQLEGNLAGVMAAPNAGPADPKELGIELGEDPEDFEDPEDGEEGKQ